MAAEQQKQPNYQDSFLKKLRANRTPVTIHVINGYQLNHAVILAYDSFVLIVEHGGKECMIYKHAVSTITPESAPAKEKE